MVFSELVNFLESHKKKENDQHTHSQPGKGSYTINENELDEFYGLINRSIFEKNDKITIFEKIQSKCPLVIDLDFKYKEKLSERQYLALEEVREAWSKTYAGISAKDLHEKHPDEFKKQINAKATLDQLVKKGFLKCDLNAVEGRGIVALFKPCI